MCPCRAFYGCVCVFFVRFSPDIWVFVFSGHVGLNGSRISSEKGNSRKRLERGTLSTSVCKFQGLSKKRRGHLDFRALKYQNHGMASKFLGFGLFSILGVAFDLILFLRTCAVSSLNICAKNCANVPWNTWKRLVQKRKWVLFFILR